MAEPQAALVHLTLPGSSRGWQGPGDAGLLRESFEGQTSAGCLQ